MRKIQLIVENQFVSTSQSNKDIGITVFDRVFNKLLKKQGSLGKVQPVYIEVGGSLKVLGVITLNLSGSFSFFPELPGESDFDHFTFVKDYNGHHHVTRVSDQGREKILPIAAELLTNEILHGISFIINDLSLLKDAPKEIHYPEVDSSDISRIEEAFFTAGKQEGSTILKNDSIQGTLCAQFFLIPKGVNFRKKLSVYPMPIKTFSGEDIESHISVFNAVIPHEYQAEYSLGIVYFSLHEKIDHPLLISMTVPRGGFYSKIPIKHLKNGEHLLNKSKS